MTFTIELLYNEFNIYGSSVITNEIIKGCCTFLSFRNINSIILTCHPINCSNTLGQKTHAYK